jgi:ribonuclease T1
VTPLHLPKPPRLPGGLPWFPVIVVVLLLAAFVLTRPAGNPWGDLASLWPFRGDSSTATPGAGVSTRSASVSASRGGSATTGALPACEFSGLPAEASATAKLVRAGGPFPYPRNDGVVFHNNSALLPTQRDGYYHEYTVSTPGLKTRGERRLVTGGKPLTSPPEWYYTGDHYESFCAITGAS